MRRRHKRSRNRVALAKGLAWLLVPMLPGAVSAQVKSERAPVIAPVHVDAAVLTEQLRILDVFVACCGTARRVLDDGLVVCFVPREGLRAEAAAWVLAANARTPSTE